ncbi:MAG: lambda exonuclease family protein [Hyphomonadaceae bacterium]
MIEQGTPEWRAQRCGKVTASRIADMLARTKTGWGASRANYAAQLICERLTGAPADGYASDAMRFGAENEPLARAAYEFRTDRTVELCGFVDHPRIAMSGASPDGLVGADGLIEIKVPNTATHIETLLSGAVPEKYIMQMMWQIACTGRAWCDYVSFDPRLPEEMRLFIRRIERDDTLCARLEKETELFLAEIDDKIKTLRRTYAEAA